MHKHYLENFFSQSLWIQLSGILNKRHTGQCPFGLESIQLTGVEAILKAHIRINMGEILTEILEVLDCSAFTDGF